MTGRIAEDEATVDPGLLATIAALFRRYPRRSTAVVALVFLSGISEAIGVVALLPLLGLVVGQDEDVPLFGDLIGNALDTVGLTQSVGVLLTVIVLGIMAKAALKMLAMRQAGYAAAAVGRDLRLDLIRALMRARWGYFTGQPVGALANAVSGEAQRASTVFTKVTNLLARLMMVAIYVVIAFVVSWRIALVTIALGAVMALSLNFLVRASRRAGRDQTRVMKSLIARLSDGLSAIKPLKAMGREENLQPLLEDETEQLNSSQRRQVINKAMLEAAHEPIITLFVAVIIYLQLVVLGFPFSEVLFVAFLFYRTATYAGTLQHHVQSFFEAESAYWSLARAIAKAEGETEQQRTGHQIQLRQQIEFQAVSFGYTSRPVLRDASFTIPAYAMTAFIGPSGSGKTTIADLVAGLYLPSRGRVLVDGQDLAGADLRHWRQRIGYVPQELILFHESIYVNVSMGDDEVHRDDVEEALRAAGAWEFTAALPQGMDSVVGEHGMRLSGGQRQRLAIARALVRKPDLLILDEATTALDPATERAILSTLAGLRERVTMIAISHQAGLMEAADHVIRLETGPDGAVLHGGVGRLA